jgi:UDP-N-acetylglucosamine 2-epimerase (non-hydrolysing)
MIAIVLGTRPEIIKLTPIIRELVKQKVSFELIHTNQHYSEDMDEVFFKELELKKPEFNLKIGGLDRSIMVSSIISKISEIYQRRKYKYVIVQGDTNSVLAASLAATFEKIPLGHVEAGLRSYDMQMPEEENRIITDHISTHLFCPTINQKKILYSERIKRNVFVVGNTVTDSVYQNLELAETKKNNLNVNYGKYILVTLHRPSNVDNKSILLDIISSLHTIGRETNYKIILPIHPRTAQSLIKFNINIDDSLIKIIKPLGYLEMLLAERGAELIITDSGGLQEEACILKVPCVTLRDNTERPETVDVGANIIAGNKQEFILKSVLKMIGSDRNWKNPFGDGHTSEKIVRIIKNYIDIN